MALIVETGALVAGANSYVTVADADSYFADRNNTDWDALDASDQKSPFLLKAVDYLQQMYRLRWAGTRVSFTQALDWPRAYVPVQDSPNVYGSFPSYYDYNSIPQEIKTAQILLAAKIIDGDLAPDLTPEDMASMVKVGSIEVKYSPTAPSSRVFRDIDMLLKPMLKTSGIMSRISRL